MAVLRRIADGARYAAASAAIGDEQRRAARADDVHRLGARRAGRRELGVPLRAAVVDARACRRPSSPSTRTDWPTSSGAAAAAAPRRSRQRCAAIVPATPNTPPIDELHGQRRAEPRGEAAHDEGDADREQVERAGHELGADQHRRQRPTRSSKQPSTASFAARLSRHYEHTAL